MDQGFYARAYSISGSLVDAQRAVAIIDGFTSALLGDPRVEALWDSWRVSIRKHLLSVDEGAELAHGALDEISREAVHFVHTTLALPWPWLASEIANGCVRSIWNELRPTQRISQRARLEADLVAPPLAAFPRPGESIEGFRHRLQRALDELTAIERSSTHGRRKPSRDRDIGPLTTWGMWYYARHVQEPRVSVSDLARRAQRHRHHRGDVYDCGCRAAVRKGLSVAERLLKLTPTWEAYRTPDPLRPSSTASK